MSVVLNNFIKLIKVILLQIAQIFRKKCEDLNPEIRASDLHIVENFSVYKLEFFFSRKYLRLEYE